MPETPSVAPATTLLPHLTVSSISHVQLQTTTTIPLLPITTEAPPVTIIPDPLPMIIQRVFVLEKDIQELKEVDNTATLCASLKSEIPPAVNAYLGSKYVQANIINEVKNQLPKFLPKAVSDFITLVIQSTVKKALEKTPLSLAQSSSQAQSSLQAAKSLSKYELKMILFDKIEKNRSYLTHDKHQVLYDALLNSMILDDAIARGQGKKTKRSRTKEFEPSKKSSTSKESSKGKSPTKTSKSGKYVTVEEPVEEPVFEMASDDIEQTIDDVSNDADQPPDDSTQTKDKDSKEYCIVSAAKDPVTFNELMATPIDFSKYAMNRLKIDDLTQAHLVGPVYELLKGMCTSSIELEYNMEECFKALIDKLDWNNPEGDRCPFDLTKPLPLKGHPGRLTVVAKYFFINDLDFLKSLDPKKRSQLNKFSKHKVYSTRKILRVVSMKVKKLHGYGHLEEIVVRRADRQLYKFKKGDFVDLHLNDIEDMLPLAVQHKLFQLDESDIVEFIVALQSYQKKLNITKPQKTLPRYKFKELYNLSFDPPEVIYEDLNKKKRVMRAEELYKFLDGTFKTISDELHHRQNQRDLPRDIPLDRIEVLRYDTKGVKVVREILLFLVLPEGYDLLALVELFIPVEGNTGTNSYEFLLANKKCLVDAEVFQKILDICPRVQEVDFTKVLNDETTLTFLTNLGYKGLLYKHPSMLRKSRIDILWGMFYKENVDYPKLIWEDLAFQIDHGQLKKGRRENMPYPSRGKGSQGKKTADTPEAAVDVSEESDYDNIILETDVALEFGKYMSLTEAAEEEAARQVHATHERIVTEFDPEPARRRPSGIAFRDTSSVSKKLSHVESHKLKGVLTLTSEEQLAADTMQALKESKKISRRQQNTRGSSEGTGSIPGVPNKSTMVLSPSSEGTGIKPRVPDEEKVTSEAKADVILDWGSEEECEYTEEDDDDENIKWVDTDEEEEKNDDDDEKSIDLKKTNDEESDDEFVHSEEYVQDDDEETDDETVHGDELVNDDEEEEMKNVKDADTRNGDKEITDAAKADVEKGKEVKDDTKKAKLPPSGSSLSVSLGFGNQFLNHSSHTSLIGTIKDT
ncbi:hypothetical protein Tco_1330139 [Tanacetum coccineum]